MAWWWNIIICISSIAATAVIRTIGIALANKRDYPDEAVLLETARQDQQNLYVYGFISLIAIIICEIFRASWLCWGLFVVLGVLCLISLLPALFKILGHFFSLSRGWLNPLSWCHVLVSIITEGCLAWMCVYILLHKILEII